MPYSHIDARPENAVDAATSQPRAEAQRLAGRRARNSSPPPQDEHDDVPELRQHRERQGQARHDDQHGARRARSAGQDVAATAR